MTHRQFMNGYWIVAALFISMVLVVAMQNGFWPVVIWSAFLLVIITIVMWAKNK